MIQNTINAAAFDDTVSFASGTHVVGGQMTLRSGQLYIGDTMQFSGVPRSVISCNNAGSFLIKDSSNITMYGLQWVRSNNLILGAWSAGSTSNITITNCIFDNQDFVGGPDMMDWGGVRGLTIQWCSFLNGAGTSNNGFGASCSNILVTRCRFDHCREAIGWAVGNTPDPGANSHLYVTSSLFTNNQRIPIEMAPDSGRNNADDLKVTDCWIAGWSAPVGAGLCVSIVAGGNLEIARCYMDPRGSSRGGTTCLEFDVPVGKAVNIHDNNFQNSASAAIGGNYTQGPMNLITNNNFWHCASDTDVNSQSVITGSTHNNIGVPPQPVSGAGP